MRNTLYSIYCRLDATEQKTNELGNRAVETIQNEAKAKKYWKKVNRGSVSCETTYQII